MKYCELDDDKAGGYKQRGRQTEVLTDRQKENEREERIQQQQQQQKSRNIIFLQEMYSQKTY